MLILGINLQFKLPAAELYLIETCLDSKNSHEPGVRSFDFRQYGHANSGKVELLDYEK